MRPAMTPPWTNGDDLLLGDNVDFFTLATIGTTGGNDSLDGGDGADALIAGPANDSLDGGSGAPDFCDGEAGTDNGCKLRGSCRRAVAGSVQKP